MLIPSTQKDKEGDKIEIQTQEQEKKHVKLIGSQIAVKGLTLWEYNVKTKEIKEAEFQKQDLVLTSLDINEINRQFRTKVLVKPDCVYRQALNKKNLIKKLKKEGIYNN